MNYEEPSTIQNQVPQLTPSLTLEAAKATDDQALPQHRCVEAPAALPLMLHAQPPVHSTLYGILVN